jgi:hypothetical protein
LFAVKPLVSWPLELKPLAVEIRLVPTPLVPNGSNTVSFQNVGV